jgi:hypothetical protein
MGQLTHNGGRYRHRPSLAAASAAIRCFHRKLISQNGVLKSFANESLSLRKGVTEFEQPTGRGQAGL